MKSLTILFFYLIKIKADYIRAKKVYFLENNFWFAKTPYKGYLHSMVISLEGRDEKSDLIGTFYRPHSFFPFNRTCFEYILLGDLLNEDIAFFLKAHENVKPVLRFDLLFIDEVISDGRYLYRYQGERRHYIAYKSVEIISGKNINLQGDGINVRLLHIKERFSGIASVKVLKLFEYIDNLKSKRSELEFEKLIDNAKFNLCSFKKYSECLESLKKFVRGFNAFNLKEENDADSNSSTLSDLSIDVSTSMKASEFIDRLREKFNKKVKVNADQSVQKNHQETLKTLFEKCSNHIKSEMLKNNILLPIFGEYDIDYYLEELYNILLNYIVKCLGTKFSKSKPEENDLIHYVIMGLDRHLLDLQEKILKHFWDSDYMQKYFSELIGKPIKRLDNGISVENIICDYYNLFAYIANLNLDNSNSNYAHIYPMVYEYYNYRVLDALEIKIDYPAKIGQIYAYDGKGRCIKFVKDSDYFVAESGRILYCLYNVLERNNIKAIEAISLKEDVSKIFKVDEL